MKNPFQFAVYLVAAPFVLAAASAPLVADPMRFETVSNGGNCNGCSWTIAEGDITPDTPAAFRAFLAAEPYPGAIEFNSAGGNLAAAMELGRIIRAEGLWTSIGKAEPIPDTRYWNSVEGTCASACAFAFLGGAARYPGGSTDPGAPSRLGMHQFYTLDGRNIPSSDTQAIMGQVLLYVLELGINAEILSIAARTPADQMHFFTWSELDALGVVTRGGSVSRGLFVENGGLATGWLAQDDTGAIDRTITLRCSRSEGWLLQVRDHGDADYTPDWDLDNNAQFGATIGTQEIRMDLGDVLVHGRDGYDSILEVRLPDALAAFAGQELWFHTNEARNFMDILSADETLPDAETFSVLSRACGD